MAPGLIHFMHGKESGPGGSKIAALAGVARARHWDVGNLDYSHTTDPLCAPAPMHLAPGARRPPAERAHPVAVHVVRRLPGVSRRRPPVISFQQ
jgi:hypothetical protein